MIGMLITMACIVVLMVILLNSVNLSLTGAGSAKGGTVRSFEDKLHLSEMHRLLLLAAQENRDQLPVPSLASKSDDWSDNTTANFYSLLIARHSMQPKMLISGNEWNPYVRMHENYDFDAYNPSAGTFWDPTFTADLVTGSNVSFAHMPLFGERYEAHWERHSMSDRFPLIGNRGPRDGRPDPGSYTYGRDGTWGGHVLFADGHVDFIDTFTPAGIVFEEGGQSVPDNLFMMETGEDGSDAILSFTRELTDTGPVLQHD